MAKQTFATKLNGILDVDWATDDLTSITITEIKKEIETEYDFLQVLKQYSGRTVNISITEDKELEPISDGE